MPAQYLDEVVAYLEQNHLKIVTAESCTAGLIASTLAEPAGCGSWLEAAYVTYSEDTKIEALDVSEETIEQYGLTSEEVACAMAEGALKTVSANLALATTGLAGPSAGDGEVPVGTVCLAWTFKCDNGFRHFSEQAHFDGDRNQVRQAATEFALKRIPHYHQKLLTTLTVS
jgi:PncC family amidohydrolase